MNDNSIYFITESNLTDAEVGHEIRKMADGLNTKARRSEFRSMDKVLPHSDNRLERINRRLRKYKEG